MLGLDDIIATGLKIIDKVIPDPAQRDAAKLELLKQQQAGALEELKSSTQVVVAEAQGEGALQRNWRPITMMVFVSIVANNYIIYPYLSLFWHGAPLLPVPEQLWDLIKIGLGGYVVGRSVEKSITVLKG